MVAQDVLHSMDRAKGERIQGGIAFAHLKCCAMYVLVHEWHETNSVPLDDNSENNPCKFFGL